MSYEIKWEYWKYGNNNYGLIVYKTFWYDNLVDYFSWLIRFKYYEPC